MNSGKNGLLSPSFVSNLQNVLKNRKIEKTPEEEVQKHQEEEAKIKPASEYVSDQRIPNFVAQPVQNYELCATKSPKQC